MRHFYRSHMMPADVLIVADRFFDLPGVEIRHLTRIEHCQVFAKPLDILGGLHDRLVVPLHVRERRDQSFL